jgi:hypothetical protein
MAGCLRLAGGQHLVVQGELLAVEALDFAANVVVFQHFGNHLCVGHG